MLNPLSAKLIADLSDSQKRIMMNILEKDEITTKELSTLPDYYVLEPGGRVIVNLTDTKVRINNIHEAMTVLQEILDLASKTMKPSWLNNDRIIIQRPVINVESEQPAIVFKVIDGKPGAAGSGPVNSPSRRMVTPILIGRYNDPKDDSSEIYMYGQRLDYNITLSVYGKTAHEADILKEWLVDIIKIYLWYVKYSGVVDFTFVEDAGDETEALRHKRTLKYAVSIEKLTWSSFFVLKDIILQLSTSS